MPLDRPNAPKRLPSEHIERSFFRPFRLGSKNSGPLTSPNTPGNISDTPSLSPKSVPPGKTRPSSRRNPLSESSIDSTSSRHRLSASVILESSSCHVAKGDLKHLVSPASSESPKSAHSSARTSPGIRARRMLGIITGRRSESNRKDSLSPPPRRKLEGVRRAPDRLSSCTHRSQSSSDVAPDTRQQLLVRYEQWAKETSGHDEEDDKAQDEVRCSNQDDSSAADSAPKPVPAKHLTLVQDLLAKTRKRLKQAKPARPYDLTDPAPKTKTNEGLERVSSVLRHMKESQRFNRRGAQSTSNLHGPSPHGTLLRPLTGSLLSASSSIRSLLMGRPPQTTPEPTEMYAGPDGQKYFSVELSDPGAPSFLPSEAKRVNTPLGQPCLPPAISVEVVDTPAPAPPSSPDRSTLLQGAYSDDPGSMNDMYCLLPRSDLRRTQRDHVDDDEHLRRAREQYVAQIPDHLPASPLCPSNPKHPSGGLRVCPLHGWIRLDVGTRVGRSN